MFQKFRISNINFLNWDLKKILEIDNIKDGFNKNFTFSWTKELSSLI